MKWVNEIRDRRYAQGATFDTNGLRCCSTGYEERFHLPEIRVAKSLIDDKRRLVGFMVSAIEIEFIHDAWGDTLMVLAQKEEKAVRARGKDMNQGVRILRLDLS